MSASPTKDLISGDEFGEKRSRLLIEGKTDDSPEARALWERVHARDDYLWDRYAPALMEEYENQWAAISLNGEFVIRPTGSEALAAGVERFGAANFAYGRLAEFRGRDLRRW